jgi:hypothetical protein
MDVKKHIRAFSRLFLGIGVSIQTLLRPGRRIALQQHFPHTARRQCELDSERQRLRIL